MLRRTRIAVLAALLLVTGLSASPAWGAVEASICEIQGDGQSSPLEGETVTTTGVVYALESIGFYIQDPTCDRDLSGDEPGNRRSPHDKQLASQGIFVFGDAQPSLGDQVEVTGEVAEFFRATEIVLQSLRVLSTGNPLPDPTAIDTDLAQKQDAVLQEYYESLEHMRVHLEFGRTYVGTNRFGESFLVPYEITERVRRTDPDPSLFALDDGLLGGGFVANFAFDDVRGAVGPLAFTFGNFKLKVEDPSAVEVTASEPPRPEPIVDQPEGTVGVATWNLFNVFDEKEPDDSIAVPSIPPPEQEVKRQKIARGVVDFLNAPAVIGVQEVENLELLEAIADAIDAYLDLLELPGDYEAFLIEGNDVRGIDVGFLIDVSVVEVQRVLQIKADEVSDGRCEGGASGDLVYDRVPLLAELLVEGETWYVVTNHFKSKFGGTPENDFFEDCRVEQAETLLEGLEEMGIKKKVVINGDLNAFRDAPTLDVFERAGYVNTVNDIPEDRRFTFVFEGKVQFLDHALVSRDIKNRVKAVDSSKLDLDVPFPLFEDDADSGLATSDHDPIVAYLETG